MNQERGGDVVLAAGYDGLQLVSHLETNPRSITGLGSFLLYQVQEAIQHRQSACPEYRSDVEQ